MTMKIPEAVECIISRLNENGYEAFAVGGCVRDTILAAVLKTGILQRLQSQNR